MNDNFELNLFPKNRLGNISRRLKFAIKLYNDGSFTQDEFQTILHALQDEYLKIKKEI